MTETPDRRLLLVHAHPDDESIGTGATMAKYAAEGTGVTLVTCTAGERGEILVPELEHLAWDRDAKLAEHRRGELTDAMEALGVTDHRFLGGFGRFSDSGMVWHEEGYAIAGDDRPENAFWDADLAEAATLLVEVIREVRPQVMTTYDQFGNYGHPDHVQAHRVATYAAFLAAVPTYRPDLGVPWEIAKIYWQAMSESRWRRSLRAIRDAGDTTTFGGMDPDGPLPMATPDADLAAEIDASAYADRKVAALHAHRTQIEVDGPFFALSNHVGNEVLGIESYRIAKGTPSAGPGGVETDLFAGL
jgi:N-acetyl-1-D-myo-inositol-2-amino-2-deoxy-alpha-D-glucopyranoside deacetylase